MSDSDRKLGGGAFVVGGLSFIPLIGVLFGIVTIVWGLASQKKGGKALAVVGAGGIAFTVLLYGGLFYFGMIYRGGIYDEMRQKLAQGQLNQLVQSIEFYKITHGRYPTSLEELQQTVGKNAWPFIHDPTDMNVGPRKLYYERVGTDQYYLRSVGPDGQPFTPDNILPQVHDKLGLLIAPPARP